MVLAYDLKFSGIIWGEMLRFQIMIYRFAQFELDTSKAELRANATAIALEPQVLALLTLLVENRDRLTTKDEIIERVWGGRFISDAAIASRIKSARQALGDDGHERRFIRTVHRLGFRFTADVTMGAPASPVPAGDQARGPQAEPGKPIRPSVAVLPFRLIGSRDQHATIADALAHDLITGLSRLHWLFVIARESTFRLRGAEADIDLVRDALNVRYCLSGAVEIQNDAMVVSVELCDSHDRGVVWSERFRGHVGAVHDIREQIESDVISALEIQIPLNEAKRARLIAPEHLDAWAAYHLGLQHMFRFNKNDNATATALFQRAAALEPGFARAYAGLSFTSFQDAFLGYSADIADAAARAQTHAEQCLERDPLDPMGNLTMGRAFWLRGDLDASLPWLDRAITLNPNYAQAKYARAWTEAMRGAAQHSQTDTDAAMSLSPLDPLFYGMLAVRAFSHLLRGEHEVAAEWAERAARSPGAHALIDMIAVAAHGLNGNAANANIRAQSVRARAPAFDRAAFFRAFPFRDEQARSRIEKALGQAGF
jgi:TolB-like protein